VLLSLLLFPLTAPAKGVRWTLSKLQRVAEEELMDDSAIKEELMELQLLLELGDITEEEYRDREAGLMEQLREVRRWRERLGREVASGPVRVARGDDAGE
jgi:hypothetical protein